MKKRDTCKKYERNQLFLQGCWLGHNVHCFQKSHHLMLWSSASSSSWKCWPWNWLESQTGILQQLSICRNSCYPWPTDRVPVSLFNLISTFCLGTPLLEHGCHRHCKHYADQFTGYQGNLWNKAVDISGKQAFKGWDVCKTMQLPWQPFVCMCIEIGYPSRNQHPVVGGSLLKYNGS